MLFVHHVFFWLENADSEADKAALIAGLEKMRTIEGIRLSHIGIPAATNRAVIDASYAVSWLITFDSSESEAIYQSHPVHRQFVADCQRLWKKVQVYDAIDA